MIAKLKKVVQKLIKCKGHETKVGQGHIAIRICLLVRVVHEGTHKYPKTVLGLIPRVLQNIDTEIVSKKAGICN